MSVKGGFYSFESFKEHLDTWADPLKKFVESQKMKNIYTFLSQEYSSKTIYPPKELIFNAFKTTAYDQIKIVIIGQDPYPNPGEAMGLSFSVPKGIKVPKSLANIYKCLENDKNIKFKAPSHGDLTKWANQGVLLLNATLTVIEKKMNSHEKSSGWGEFTDHVIKTISDEKKGIVFLLWGNFAKSKKKFINEKAHHVIENIHPSPLAASKGNFADSDQFSKSNQLLKEQGKEEIDWTL